MTADAEAEGKVARRRGRLSRRRVSAHRTREHPEFGDSQGRHSTASVSGESLLSTRQHGARRTSSLPGNSRGTADVRWCRSQPTSDFRRSARHDAVEIRDQRLPKPTAAPEARAGTSERRGRGVYGSCEASSRRPPRRRRGGGFCLVGELRRPPESNFGGRLALGRVLLCP